MTNIQFSLSKIFLILSLSNLIIGCSVNIPDKTLELNTFFKDFTLNQSNSEGNIVFKMNSPQAVITKDTRAVNAKSTEITFYENENPIYNVISDRSTISSDGKLIVLYGNVFLTRINENKITMTADKVEWSSIKDTISFEGNVLGNMETSKISSSQAIYYLKDDIMIFSDLKEYIVKNDNNEDNIFELKAKTATWNGSTGKLIFDSSGNEVNSKFYIPLK